MPKIRIRAYTLTTRKIKRPLCLVVVSDLHGCPYGEGQSELLAAMAGEGPDAVLITGDMNDVRDSDEPFWDFAKGAVRLAPCYYVTGNHEFASHSCNPHLFSKEKVLREKERLRGLGVRVLEGTKELLSGGDGSVAIMGIDDIFIGEKEFDEQYLRCCRAVEAEQYTVLLSHRPEQMGAYRFFPGDLVVCGHAHGGQWRLPGIRGGVYAPGQGLFPEYAGGLYRRDAGYLLVSAGLCYRYPRLPRFGNPVELAVVRLAPE